MTDERPPYHELAANLLAAVVAYNLGESFARSRKRVDEDHIAETWYAVAEMLSRDSIAKLSDKISLLRRR